MVASAGTTQEKPVTPGDPVQTEQQNKVLSSPGQLEKEDKTLGNHVHIKKEDNPLGEHQYLEKQDQLRDIGIATGTSRVRQPKDLAKQKISEPTKISIRLLSLGASLPARALSLRT